MKTDENTLSIWTPSKQSLLSFPALKEVNSFKYFITYTIHNVNNYYDPDSFTTFGKQTGLRLMAKEVKIMTPESQTNKILTMIDLAQIKGPLP